MHLLEGLLGLSGHSPIRSGPDRAFASSSPAAPPQSDRQRSTQRPSCVDVLPGFVSDSHPRCSLKWRLCCTVDNRVGTVGMSLTVARPT